MTKENSLQTAAQSGVNLAAHYDKDRMTTMLTMASQFSKSGALPATLNNAEKVFVVLQTGFEMGLTPMESMNSLYIVKGSIKPYGTFWSKKLKENGFKIKYEDKEDSQGNPSECTVTVTRDDEEFSFTAKKKMVSKGVAYGFAPMEKLRYHALSRIVQFDVPEIMPAGLSFTEEDRPPVAEVTPTGESGGFSKTKPEETIVNADTGEIVDAIIVEETTEEKPLDKKPLDKKPEEQTAEVSEQTEIPSKESKKDKLLDKPEEKLTNPKGRIHLLFQKLGLTDGSGAAASLLKIHANKHEIKELTEEECQALSSILEEMIKNRNENNGKLL